MRLHVRIRHGDGTGVPRCAEQLGSNVSAIGEHRNAPLDEQPDSSDRLRVPELNDHEIARRVIARKLRVSRNNHRPEFGAKQQIRGVEQHSLLHHPLSFSAR